MARRESDQRAASHVTLAFGVWLTTLALSLIIPFLIAPKGSGFTRGLNRLEPSLWLQLFGFLVAAWGARATLRNQATLPKLLRVLGLVPLALYLVTGLLLIAFVVTD